MPLPDYRKCKKKEEMNTEAWVTSFGDMMSLLLTFFIVIVSFSSIEIIKFRRFLGALQGSSGVLGEQEGASIVQKEASKPDLQAFNQELLRNVIQNLEDNKKDMLDQGVISFEKEEFGVKIKILSPFLFDPGQAILKPQAYDILRRLALVAKATNCDITIEGHTDNTPIHTPQFPSNWELSAARALAVLHYFVDRCKVNPYKVEALGRGPYRPIAFNDTAQGRRMNRRVEIFIGWKYKSGEELLRERQYNLTMASPGKGDELTTGGLP